MAKKASGKDKESRLNVRATPDELSLWGKAAQLDGRTLTSWVKWTLSKAARSQVDDDAPPPKSR
jgi:uncharacterized protein (DUF1778 family)